MRVIRFRGKRKGGTEWLIGDLNHIEGQVFIFPREKDTPMNSPDWFEVEPESVGQFTGKKDKNGKEIYEGDIVLDHYTEATLQVCNGFCSKLGFTGWYCKYMDRKANDTFINGDYSTEKNSRIEVIGNIHEDKTKLL